MCVYARVGQKLLPSYDPPPPVSSVGSGRWAAPLGGTGEGRSSWAGQAGSDCVFVRGVVVVVAGGGGVSLPVRCCCFGLEYIDIE